MEDVKRGRGRPPGSGDDDSAPLMAVARLMIDDPKLKPTTAMKQVRRTRSDWDSSDEALIRRWQVKWKADKAIYLQRVHDERAAAEREQQARLARQADTRPMAQVMAEMARNGSLSGFTGGNALREFFAQHDSVMPLMPGLRALVEGHALSQPADSVAQLFAEGRLAGRLPAGAAMRAAMGIQDDSRMQEMMRKHDAMGRASLEASILGQMPKLPKGV